MVQKKKHIKQLKKQKLKRLEEKKKYESKDIDFDTSAYVVYNRLSVNYPCLSFDIVTDELGSGLDRVSKFPLSLTLVAGAQTPPHVENNYIYVMQASNIKPLKQEEEDEDDDEEGDGEENDTDLPLLTSVKVAHKGCVNRIRVTRVGGRTLAASWSDKGKVYIYDVTTSTHAVVDQRALKTYTAQKVDPKPIFTFGGHLSEGYALDWSPFMAGSLATGDCKKNIHIWTMRSSDWLVDQQPLSGHENSVEDIKWSPETPEILASCSVDRSVRIWDLREKALSRCTTKILSSHNSDVNVLDWNKRCKHLLVSGGDDGVVKIWDIRSTSSPVAQFDYHKKPITSVEWNPNDDTVVAVSSDDDKLTLWDLAVEKDEEEVEEQPDMEVEKAETSDSDDDDEEEEQADENEEEEEGVNYADAPEQLLFLHQGQSEIKEIHWHPQMPGLVISTGLDGINIFKTISA